MTAHSQRAHAKLFPPSGAERYMECFGSVSMCASIVEASSVFAASGTASHELAAHCLETGFDADRFKGWVINTVGNPKFRQVGQPNGVTTFLVDAARVDSIQTYLEVAREIAQESDDFEIEHRLDLSSFVEDQFGTGDCIAYRSDRRRVTVCDYKDGQGVAVEVRGNRQLMTYALGVAQRYHNRGVDEIEIVIVQPRAPHPDGPTRRWVTDIVGLYEHAFELQHAVVEARKPNAPLVAGPHCIKTFCKAAGACPALRAKIDEIIGAIRINGELKAMGDPRLMPFRDWGVEEAELNLVKGWLRRREEYAHSEAMRGNMPPGAKLVQKRPTRRWKDPAAAATQLQMLGVEDDDLFETSMRSPAQVEKCLPKGERSVINDLSDKVSSGTVLAPINDSRPAIADAADGFDAVEIEER